MIEGADRIDVGGLSVPRIHRGAEPDRSPRGRAGRRHRRPPVRTGLEAPWIAVNPDSDLIPVSRSAGILHTLAVPLGGTIPGRASVLRMDGWTTEDPRCAGCRRRAELADGAPIRPPGCDAVATSSATRCAAPGDRRWFDAAEAWTAAKAAVPRSDRPPVRVHGSRPRGRAALFIRADSRGQIETAIAWATRRGYRPASSRVRRRRLHRDPHRHRGPVLTGTHRKPAGRHHPVDAVHFCHVASTKRACSSRSARRRALGRRGIAYNAATAAHGLPKHAAARGHPRPRRDRGR